jgi:PqqD family protein of HPr-rel-A system
MLRYQRIPGSLIEDLGNMWAALSPASGETHLLNDESALVLECLAELGPATAAELAKEMAPDTGMSADDVERRLAFGWASLLEAGLVRALSPDARQMSGYPQPS